MSKKRIGTMPNLTHAEATLARQRLIKQLRRSDVEAAVYVADSLYTCSMVHPCLSAACPACGAAFQDVMVAVGDEFIRASARSVRNRAHALTIVPSIGCVAPDHLTVAVFEQVAAAIAAALARFSFPPTIIGLEASFNEDVTGEVEPHWSVHGHTNGVDWPSATQVTGLKAAFPPSPWVKRPVRIDLLDDRVEGRRYAFKPERFRRVTQLVTDNPDRAPYRDSKHRSLRPWQAVSLAIVEHQLGFNRRLLIHGIDESAFRECLRGLG